MIYNVKWTFTQKQIARLHENFNLYRYGKV